MFISHSGQDTWVAKQIAREIEACGAKPFLDEAEIDAGADFEEVFAIFSNGRMSSWFCSRLGRWSVPTFGSNSAQPGDDGFQS